MKRFFAIFLILAALVALPLAFASNAQSEYSNGYVYDDCGTLQKSEVENLNTAISNAKTKCYVIFTSYYFYPYNLDKNTKYYLEKMGANTSSDCVVLTVDMNERLFDIFTYGSASKIKNSEINYMMSALEKSFKKGEYFGGANTFVAHSQKAMSGRLGVPMIKVFGISLIIGVVFSCVVCTCVISAYKKKERERKYPLEKYTSYNIKEQSDKHIGTTVVSVPIKSRSSGGARSSGSSHRGRGRF